MSRGACVQGAPESEPRDLNGGAVGPVVAVVLPAARLVEVGVIEAEVLAGVECPAEVVIRCSLGAARAVAGMMFRGRVRVAISLTSNNVPSDAVHTEELSEAETLPAPPEVPPELVATETVDGGVVERVPVSDEYYADVVARHVARGLAVPPRSIVEMGPLAPDAFVTAWSCADGSSTPTEPPAEERCPTK